MAMKPIHPLSNKKFLVVYIKKLMVKFFRLVLITYKDMKGLESSFVVVFTAFLKHVLVTFQKM
jgi:hypothetical protein